MVFEDLNDELSDYIKLLRFKSKKSQEEVANDLNISRNTYMLWEKKPISLSLDTLSKLVNFLGEDIVNFFTYYVAKCNQKENKKE